MNRIGIILEGLNNKTHIKGSNANELKANLEAEGYKLDSADWSYVSKRPKTINGDKLTLFKGNKEYDATFNYYSDGGMELINFEEV
jgi:hypothetical protein